MVMHGHDRESVGIRSGDVTVDMEPVETRIEYERSYVRCERCGSPDHGMCWTDAQAEKERPDWYVQLEKERSANVKVAHFWKTHKNLALILFITWWMLVAALIAASVAFGGEVQVKTLPANLYTVTKAQLPAAKAPEKATEPSAKRRRSAVCTSAGCGCGCLGDGPCRCHPNNWDRMTDGWRIWHDQQGNETHAFDPETKTYWKKRDGKWVEWKEETRIDAGSFRRRAAGGC